MFPLTLRIHSSVGTQPIMLITEQVNIQSAIRNYPRDIELGVGQVDENGVMP